jgi:hypothetical protein
MLDQIWRAPAAAGDRIRDIRMSRSSYSDDTHLLDDSRGSLGSSNGNNGIIRDIPSPPTRLLRDTSAPSSLLAYYEAASQSYLDEDRHVHFLPLKEPDIPVTWRLKERMKVRQHDSSQHCPFQGAGAVGQRVRQTASWTLS